MRICLFMLERFILMVQTIMTGALNKFLENHKADATVGRQASEASPSPNCKCLLLVYSFSYIE